MLVLQNRTCEDNLSCRWCDKTIWAETNFCVAIAIPKKKFFGNYHHQCMYEYLQLNDVKIKDTRNRGLEDVMNNIPPNTGTATIQDFKDFMDALEKNQNKKR